MKQEIINSSIYKTMLLLLVILPIYQDSPLSKYLGAAGYSLLMPLSLVLIFLLIIYEGRIYKNEYINTLMKLGIWIFIVSILAVIIWVVLEKSIVYIGENLIVKVFKVCLQYMSYVSYVYLMVECLKKCGVKTALKYAFYAMIIMTIICFIEIKQTPYAFEKLHFSGEFPYWRVRLLTLEASMTSLLIYNYAILAIVYALSCKSKIKLLIALFSSIYLFFNTGSKTLMISVAITFLIIFLMNIKKLSMKKIIKMLVILIVGFGVLYNILPKLIESFSTDMTEYTSVATRGYTIFIGILLGIFFPVGVGGSVYMGVLQWALKKYMFIFDLLPIKLNTKEIVEIANSKTDNAVTVKSGIFQYNIYWGIIGTLIFMRSIINLIKKIKESKYKFSNVIIAAFITNVLLIMFSNNFCFEFWLLYSINVYISLGVCNE